MKPISYARHRFPPDVIRHAVWLYLRFTLSYRDVEYLLAEKGLEVSNESIRRWVLKFGSAIARNLRSIRPRPPAHRRPGRRLNGGRATVGANARIVDPAWRQGLRQ